MKNHLFPIRSIALMLSLILLLVPLAACSKKPALDLDTDSLAVYDLTEYTVGQQYSYIQNMIWANGEIIALAADAMGKSTLARISTTGQLLGELDLSRIPGLSGETFSASADGLFSDPTGNLYLTVTDYSNPAESVRTLYQLDKTGAVLKSFPVFVSKSDGSTLDYLNNILFTPTGQIVLVFGMSVQLIDANGQKISEYKLNGQYISLAMIMSNGNLSISYYDQDGIKSEEIDVKTGTKIQDQTLPPQLFNSAPVAGPNGLYYLNGYQYLSSYDDQTGLVTKLMSWLDLDINRNNIAYMWIAAPDGSFYFGEYIYPENNGIGIAEASLKSSGEEPAPTDWVPPANPTFKLIHLAKSADQSAIKKTNITIGAFWMNESLRKGIIEFRKVRPDVRFTVLDYSENIDYSKANAYEDAIVKINADIIAGKMPDMMMVNNLPWRQYANKGLLADLGELMDDDKDFDRTRYLTNFFDASTIDGKQYILSSSVMLTGIVSSRDLVGDRTGWTVQEFQALVDAQTNQDNLFYQMPGESILNMLLMGNLNAYVDAERGIANFDTPDFIQLLEFSKKYGVNPEQMYSEEGRIYNGEETYQFPAFQMAYLSRFEDFSMYNTNYKGQATLLGLPSPQKSGPLLQGGSPIAIAANSRHTDIVWEFLKFMLSESQQDLMIKNYEGFPVLRTSLDKAAQEAIEAGKKIQSGQSVPDYWYSEPVTQADVDTAIHHLTTATTLLSYDEKANQLIYEETQAFFAGDKTASETAASIQSRLKAYIGEQ